MKRIIKFCVLLLIAGCSYDDRSTWDSGREAQETYEEKSHRDTIENTKSNIPPTTKPHTEVSQPF